MNGSSSTFKIGASVTTWLAPAGMVSAAGAIAFLGVVALSACAPQRLPAGLSSEDTSFLERGRRSVAEMRQASEGAR